MSSAVSQQHSAGVGHDAGPGVSAGPIPRHVAIIMDGNGRWAVRRSLDRVAGHRQGVANIRRVVDALARRGVSVITVYAFSTENWNRPAPEVDALMTILAEEIEPQTRELHQAGVRLVHIGNPEPLNPQLRQAIAAAQKRTRRNDRATLNIAFNYGGRDEILRAVRRIIADNLPPEQLDETRFSRYLYTAGCPDPDLIIRTGGEQRISNFLLWQAAYSEYYHTPVLWPDLDEAELDAALDAYRRRQRRFGALVVPDADGNADVAPAPGSATVPDSAGGAAEQ